MTWLLTRSGHDVDLRFIADCELTIQDVAYGLSHVNRFTGQALRAVSCAEHSLIMTTILNQHMGITSPSVLLACLLRDAHKALTGDVSWAMQQLVPSWRLEEQRIQRMVLRRFGVWTAFCGHHSKIHQANQLALSTERNQLMHPNGQPWPVSDTHPALPELDLQPSAVFNPADWAKAYLNRYNELITERAQLATAYGIN
jgi:hypothetical protein